MRGPLAIALASVLAAGLASCAAPPASTGKPLVLATTTIFADMAAKIGGDRVAVESIVPAGSHVEEYEPKPEDSKKVAQAALFFQNGLDLDKWAEPLLRDRKKDASVITLTDGLPAIDHDNPHMWFDLALARKYVEKIRDGLDAWRESIATTLLVAGDAAQLRRIAELVRS